MHLYSLCENMQIKRRRDWRRKKEDTDIYTIKYFINSYKEIRKF